MKKKLITLNILLFVAIIGYGQSIETGTLYYGTDKYVGSIKAGKADGQGIYYYTDGSIYEGYFKAGEFTGKGTMKWKSGDEYVGNWINSKKDGQGIIKWANGNSYKGDWKNDAINGTGTYTWANGTVYTGEFENYNKSGNGTIKWIDGGSYNGSWKNDVRDGQGKVTLANGFYRKGLFKNDVDEKVKYYNKSDEEISFEEYKGNPKSGLGTCFYGEEKYVGNFENYKPNGKGIYYFADGTTYEGYLVNGEFEGKGTRRWTSGDSYTGDWKNSKRAGIGIYTWSDGDSYSGGWENNEKSGIGTFKKANGYSYSGEYKNGEIKKSTFYNPKGETITNTAYYNANPSANSTTTANTTAGGIQYSTADMSEFTNKYRLLGVMIVYSEATQFSKPFPYFFDVYGTSMKNENAVFNALKGRLNSYYNYSKYSWKPGASTFSLTRGLDLRSYETKGKYDIE